MAFCPHLGVRGSALSRRGRRGARTPCLPGRSARRIFLLMIISFHAYTGATGAVAAMLQVLINGHAAALMIFIISGDKCFIISKAVHMPLPPNTLVARIIQIR